MLTSLDLILNRLHPKYLTDDRSSTLDLEPVTRSGQKGWNSAAADTLDETTSAN